MNLFAELRSRIQYKIILPFLLLTLLVALTGSAISLLIITGSAQDRLNNQLAQVARSSSDTIVQIERANLALLREIVFASANPYSGAPAVADALAAGDTNGLTLALDPFFRISAERGARIDRLIAFDHRGQSLVDWERSTAQSSDPTRLQHPSQNLSQLWFVTSILNGDHDPLGDKYAGLLSLTENERYVYTVAPVVVNQQVIGGVIVGIHVDTLVREMAGRTQTALITLYDPVSGAAFASSATPVAPLESLQIRPELLATLRPGSTPEQARAIFDTIHVNEREYQLAFTALRIRERTLGIISVGLAGDYVTGPWADVRLPLLVLTLLLMLTIITLGIFIARQITRPLKKLVTTAQAVIDGDLERRSDVIVENEIGVLSNSFNEMTAHLLELYRTVRAESNRRAAVFESITDGIAVVAPDGAIQMTNPAMRTLLGLTSEQALPTHLAEFPLQRLSENALNFGGRGVQDLFQLGDRIVRLARAPIKTDGGRADGFVFVFQDMTNQVAIDRAKTNFIATISHELRTPLTVIGGNSDLLLMGLMGRLQDEQRPLVEAIRTYTNTTTALINNIITAASLDAGTITFQPEVLNLAELLQDELRPVRRMARAKDLQIELDLAEDLPLVLADDQQLRTALRQLLDNACRYTQQGQVAIHAFRQNTSVRIDIRDTGPGIEPGLQQQLFTRFTRGSEGINSTERGIGLGLALARELIEPQHGQLWLDQTCANGSTFSLTIPYAEVAPPTSEVATVANLAV